MAKNRKSISLRNSFAILTYFAILSYLFLSLLVNISRIVARQHMKEELEREV